MTDPRIGAVVLAAGQGQRFGPDPKQLADLGGRALVAIVVETAVTAGAGEVVVVLGRAHRAVRGAVPPAPNVRVVTNTAWRNGISTSVRCGLRALSSRVDVAVVLLADQPDVATEAVTSVAMTALHRGGIARALYEDGPSHPVALARPTWRAVDGLRGDEGARQLFEDHGVHGVVLAGPRPVDIDRPADLTRRRDVPPEG